MSRPTATKNRPAQPSTSSAAGALPKPMAMNKEPRGQTPKTFFCARCRPHVKTEAMKTERAKDDTP
eukprot:11569869-Prorocentrum_lima.AAC.1